MRLALTLALGCALFAGCKKTSSEPAAAEAEAPKVKWEVEMPADGKKLAEKLVEHGLNNVNPSGSSDFSMNFQFTPAGTWTADGHARLGGETLDCVENGTWKIDEMVEAKGRLEWTIAKTNCPNRTVGDSQRALVGFEGKDASISFR